MNAPLNSELLIHPFSEADRPFVMALVKEKYPDRYLHGVRYVEWCLTQPDKLVAVGPNSFCVAAAYWNYGFERRAGASILCARPVAGSAFEVLRLVRYMVAWAKQQGCEGSFRLQEDTGVDFGPLARRLGGSERIVWEIPVE